jgi:hypothetical protein
MTLTIFGEFNQFIYFIIYDTFLKKLKNNYLKSLYSIFCSRNRLWLTRVATTDFRPRSLTQPQFLQKISTSQKFWEPTITETVRKQLCYLFLWKLLEADESSELFEAKENLSCRV